MVLLVVLSQADWTGSVSLTGDVEPGGSGAVCAQRIPGHAEVGTVVGVLQPPETQLRLKAVGKAATLALLEPGEALHRRGSIAAAGQSGGAPLRYGPRGKDVDPGGARGIYDTHA